MVIGPSCEPLVRAYRQAPQNPFQQKKQREQPTSLGDPDFFFIKTNSINQQKSINTKKQHKKKQQTTKTRCLRRGICSGLTNCLFSKTDKSNKAFPRNPKGYFMLQQSNIIDYIFL